MSKITVYYFKGYVIDTDKVTRSRRMATLEWIEKRGFTPINETARMIEDSALDSNGLYREAE
jgi:hypothetical protein